MDSTPRVCPACGAENTPASRFCAACGQKLDIAQDQTMMLAPQPAAPPEPPPAAPAAPPPMPPAAVLPPVTPPPPPAPAPPLDTARKPNYAPLIVILVLLFLIFAIVGALVAIKLLPGQTDKTKGIELPAPANVQAEPPTTTPEPVEVKAPPATEEVTPQPRPKPVKVASRPATEAAPGGVSSPDQALNRVRARSEVKEWLGLIEQAQRKGKQRKSVMQVDTEDDASYTVHVFESVEDDDPPHTATFAWYRVDKQTGQVTEIQP